MKFSPVRLLRDLTGKSDRQFVHLLLAQIDAALVGAELVRKVVTMGEGRSVALREQIRHIEHDGDEKRRQVVHALSTALVTPIDREDLFRLSGGIDDILDMLRDFAREWDLYRMTSSESFSPLLEEVLDGLTKLRDAAAPIADDPASIPIGALQAKKAGNRIRSKYQRAMAELFDAAEGSPVTVDVMRHRELLRRLDIVGLRIRQAAELLADAAVKRSH